MTAHTLNLQLPLLEPAQALKHIVVNESLTLLDSAAQLRLTAIDVDVPPTTRDAGRTYATGANPAGDWIGQAHMLAIDLGAQWRFCPLNIGTQAVDLSDLSVIVWTGMEWDVSGARETRPEFEALGVGTNPAANQVMTLEGKSALMSADVDDFRLSLNRNGVSDVCSIMMQTGFVTGAEFGLVGDDRATLRTFDGNAQMREHLAVSPAIEGVECAALRSTLVSVALDQVASVTPPRNSGILLIVNDHESFPQIQLSAIIIFDTGQSPTTRTVFAGTGVSIQGHADLRQTPGPNSKLSVAVQPNEILLGNRFGSHEFSLTFLG